MKVKDTVIDEIITRRITEIEHASLKIQMCAMACEGAKEGRCSCRETTAIFMQISRGVIEELQRLREQEIAE